MPVFNFNAGPAKIPTEVFTELRQQLVDFNGTGLSLLEMSHRSDCYQQLHHEVLAALRRLLALPDDFAILLLGGGATLQFAMIPLNFLNAGQTAEYLLSGSWAVKAWQDAQKIGQTTLPFDGRQHHFTSLPATITVDPEAAYLHLTSNETIDGLQWPELPDCPIALFADMSSDIMSRRLDWGKIKLAYAGAQKNLGCAGVTVVILAKDLLDRCQETLPAYLNYRNHVRQNSLYNTPPVSAIQLLALQLNWIEKQGGVDAMAALSERKSSLLYQTIDNSGGFYSNLIDSRVRSQMNVIFQLQNNDMEKKFLQQSAAAGFVGLQGHRSKGGVRASLYNAVDVAATTELVRFMQDFQRRQGG